MREKIKPLVRLSLLFLLLLGIFVPRGSFTTKVVLGVDKEGRKGVFVFSDPSLIQQFRERELISVGDGLVEKKDYFFWVDYCFKARANTGGMRGEGPYYLRVYLPGAVAQGNADEIKEGQAYWVLNENNTGNLILSTRAYRYYALIGFLVAAIALIYNYFQGKSLNREFFSGRR